MLLTRGHLTRFARDRRAASAVEFALSLPFLLVLYIGGIQLSQAVSADRKVTLLARTVGDLVAQSASLSSTDVQNILSISTAVLYPLPLTDGGGTSKVTMKVSEVWTNSKNITKVDWSKGQNATADTSGQTVTIPDPEGDTATVMAVVSYTYTPTVSFGIIGPLTMTKTIYMRPRLSECVALDGAICGSAAYGS